MTTHGPGDPGNPVDLRMWRPERPPAEARPFAAPTTLGRHLLLAGGQLRLALVPPAEPPLAPGEDPPTGPAGGSVIRVLALVVGSAQERRRRRLGR